MSSSMRGFGLFRTVVVGLGALAATTFVLAGVGTWTSNGPAGVVIKALAIDPSTPGVLYAGGEGGVFKSNDAGGSWTAMNAGLTQTSVRALAVDPSAPAMLYAGTPSGVFKSIDGGGHWSAIGLTDSYVTALAIDPKSPATLYAGTGTGVFKSVNRGASWDAINEGFSNNDITALSIDPKTPATLYAGTFVYFCEDFDSCLFKSTNGGDSWGAVHVDRFNPYPSTLTIDPVTPTTLYVGTFFNGVFKSSDSGESWTAINAGLPRKSAFSLAGVYSLALDPTNPATLYAGTDAGVFKSSDGGGGWTAMNGGLTDVEVSAVAFDPRSPATLHAGTGAGVFDYQAFVGPCVPDPTTLCLNGGRFQVRTQWTTLDGSSGQGQARSVTGDAGYFTFFDPANVEVMVKILNGCGANGRFWNFAGGLTDVGVVMTVADSETGDVNTYTNPLGTPFRPIQDVNAFATCAFGPQEGAPAPAGYAGAPVGSPIVSESFDASAAPCVADATTLCLNDSRYRVQAQWSTPGGRSGAGQVIPLTEDTGAFWFFSAGNVEMVIKVLNACSVNSRHWAFAGGLTNVDVNLTVTDTQTGLVKTYANAPGTPFPPIQDTDAFATCP